MGFLPADLSLLEPQSVAWQHLLSSRQLTDVYLLALAVRRGVGDPPQVSQ